MNESASTPRHRAGKVTDANGRRVTRLDPVKMFMLHQPHPIPANALEAMATELLPGARRYAFLQVVIVILGFAFVIGGNLILFRYVTTWQGLDPVTSTIFLWQILVLLWGPWLAMRTVRTKYASRVVQVMLRHRYCPHCGYDLRALPARQEHTVTICPECGCGWQLTIGNTVRQ